MKGSMEVSLPYGIYIIIRFVFNLYEEVIIEITSFSLMLS